MGKPLILNHTVELRRPISVQIGAEPAKEITTIELDFTRLTGRAMSQAERSYMAQLGNIGVQSTAPATTDEYCAICAAVAADLPEEAIFDLIAPDYQEVVYVVKDFLMDTGGLEKVIKLEKSA